MNQQQPFQILELAYAKVWCQHRLHSLLPRDTNPDVSSFDHGNVVCTVSNCQCDSFFVPLHQVNNLGFLQRCHTTAHHCLKHLEDSKLSHHLVSQSFPCNIAKWTVVTPQRLSENKTVVWNTTFQVTEPTMPSVALTAAPLYFPYCFSAARSACSNKLAATLDSKSHFE